MPTPTLDRIVVYPVKSLDPHELDRATVREGGGLTHDREFAVVDGEGRYVNGKREPKVHRLRSAFDPGAWTLTLREPGGDAREFDLDDRAELAAWLSAYFGYPVEVRRDDAGGMPDDTDASGPTVIAAETLRAVASWFPGVDAAEMRRRLRPNLVVGGVPAFWEDRLYADPERVVAFRAGEAVLEGVNPCGRCVVPTRDPDTGEATPGFRETFVRKREETLPAWAERAWFDHYFRLMVNTRVPGGTPGDEVAVGDDLEVLGERPR